MIDNNNSISAIIPTLGNRNMRKLLESLARQTMPPDEVIVVHQGTNQSVAAELADFDKKLNIKYIRSATQGASRARNEGARHASGKYIFFPDDDCWYPPDFCEIALKYVLAQCDIVGGRSCPDETQKQTKLGRFGAKSFKIVEANVLKSTIEFAIFAEHSVVKAVQFNPHLGVGSGTLLGSDEGVDFILRAVHSGYLAIYAPELIAYHPDPLAERAESLPSRGRKYATGRGYILFRYKFPMHVILRELGGPLIRIIQMGMRLDILLVKYYSQVFFGKISGMMMSRRSPDQCI
jgi:glycosyltransferase involved in cell wall biosynthesis